MFGVSIINIPAIGVTTSAPGQAQRRRVSGCLAPQLGALGRRRCRDDGETLTVHHQYWEKWWFKHQKLNIYIYTHSIHIIWEFKRVKHGDVSKKIWWFFGGHIMEYNGDVMCSSYSGSRVGR